MTIVYALCHPQRPNVAKGLCGACYQRHKKRADPVLEEVVEQYEQALADLVTRRAVARRESANARRRTAAWRERTLIGRYGLERGQYATMLAEQNGACFLCREIKSYPLCVDHCHTTGRVRRLLCHRCNTVVSVLEGDAELLRRATKYCGVGQDDRAPTLTDQTWADDAVARAKAMKADVLGPCAKQVVKATILTKIGARYTGFNHCCKPQKTCPRDAAGFETGEGYELCKSVCKQVGHAEEVAIETAEAAGADIEGATLYLEGHTYACEKCKNSALLRGIEIVVGAPPR